MGRDSPIVLSSDSEEGEPVEVEDVKGKVKEVEEDFKEPPKWLPDGWIMEVQRGEDGSFYQYYISPVSGVKLRMKAEVLSYLFSGMDDRFLESKKCAARNTLHSTHLWLPKGWFIEIRAGGENMDKMFKFYIYPPMEIRLFSKEDVLLYVKEMVVSACDTEGQCDTSSQDNILALVEFNPSVLLPEGWVKEIVYRKTKEGIRKDPYFTDPVNHYVFRTLKAAMTYLSTGKITNRSFIQKTSVHDLYNFDKCADLNEFLRKRLTNKTGNNDQTSDRFEDGESSTDFGSPKDHQESMNKSKKIKEKEPNSDKIIKRSRRSHREERKPSKLMETQMEKILNLSKKKGWIKQTRQGVKEKSKERALEIKQGMSYGIRTQKQWKAPFEVTSNI